MHRFVIHVFDLHLHLFLNILNLLLLNILDKNLPHLCHFAADLTELLLIGVVNCEFNHHYYSDQPEVDHNQSLFVRELKYVGQRVSGVQIGNKMHLLGKLKNYDWECEFGCFVNGLLLELESVG